MTHRLLFYFRFMNSDSLLFHSLLESNEFNLVLLFELFLVFGTRKVYKLFYMLASQNSSISNDEYNLERFLIEIAVRMILNDFNWHVILPIFRYSTKTWLFRYIRDPVNNDTIRSNHSSNESVHGTSIDYLFTC